MVDSKSKDISQQKTYKNQVGGRQNSMQIVNCSRRENRLPFKKKECKKNGKEEKNKFYCFKEDSHPKWVNK